MITLLWVLTTSLYAQTGKRHYVGSRLSHGIADYSESRLTFSGSEKYAGSSYSSFGADYMYRTSEKVDVGVGLTVSTYRLAVSYTSLHVAGGSRSSDYDKSLVMFSVPLYLKYHFGNYFYASPGICFNHHSTLGYEWGMGAFVGMGAEYMFNYKL